MSVQHRGGFSRVLGAQCLLGLGLFVGGAAVAAEPPGGPAATSKAAAKPADKTAEKTPELKVLERLIGDWHAECVQVQGDKRERVIASISSEWLLDGHFVQSKSIQTPGGTESLQIIGYDPVKKEYRMWYFDSFGASTGPVPGQWDESTKTLTWQGPLPDNRMLVNKERFLNADNIEWHAMGTDRAGTVKFRQDGTSVRRK